MRALGCSLIFWVLLAVCGGLAGDWVQAHALQTSPSTSNSSPAIDPNREASEFNHHIAGWALMGVGLLVIGGITSSRLRSLRYVWPALFLLAGLFLALWSDAEIWPRGNLSWTWLVHHDQEARQHKIYALLLISLGVIEYLRARGVLNRFWRVFAFPILAVVGAGLLLVHDHTQGSGVHSPEVRAYLINPALDPDGNPPRASDQNSMAGMNPEPMSHDSMNHDSMKMDDSMNHGAMNMDHSSTDHGAMDQGSVDQGSVDQKPTDSGMQSMPMDHSHMGDATPQAAASAEQASHHHHHMTPSMLLVEREHFWFMVVGLGIALFKLIADSDLFHRPFVAYIWPSGMVLLGALLVLYRE